MLTKIISAVLLVLALTLGGIFWASFDIAEGTVGYLANQPKFFYQPGLHFKWPWQKLNVIVLRQNTADILLPVALPGGGYQLAWTLLFHVTSPAAYINTPDLPQQVKASLAAALKATPITALSPAVVTGLQTQTLTFLQADKSLAKVGIAIDAAWVSDVVVAPEQQSLIDAAMNAKADMIAAGIVSTGLALAQQTRVNAQNNYLAIEAQALKTSGAWLAESNKKAVALLAPDYQKNPALFKAYVDAQSKLLALSKS